MTCSGCRGQQVTPGVQTHEQEKETGGDLEGCELTQELLDPGVYVPCHDWQVAYVGLQ